MNFIQPWLKCAGCRRTVTCAFAYIKGYGGPVIPDGWYISWGFINFVAVCSEKCAIDFAATQNDTAEFPKGI